MNFSLDHVSLQVKDIEPAVEFYTALFGLFEVPPKVIRPGVRWFQLADGLTIHLIPGATEDNIKSFGDHFALATSDFESFLMRLKELAVPYGTSAGMNNSYQTRPDGVRQVYFRDPDNNLVEVNEDRRTQI